MPSASSPSMETPVSAGQISTLPTAAMARPALAFTKRRSSTALFTTSFDFQVEETYTYPLADGFTFTIQGNNPQALGGSGGGLGYYEIGNSICIKFDYYNNAGEGTDSTGLFEDGAYPDIPAIDLSGTGVNISSGDPMNVTMNYNGATLNVTITDLDTNASASQSYSVNIPSIVGSHPPSLASRAERAD